VGVQRPHKPFSIGTIWAIDEVYRMKEGGGGERRGGERRRKR
jgi:hypothetical protein